VVNFTSRPFYFQGKGPWYPLDRRLDGPHNRSGRSGEEKKIPSSRRESNPRTLTLQNRSAQVRIIFRTCGVQWPLLLSLRIVHSEASCGPLCGVNSLEINQIWRGTRWQRRVNERGAATSPRCVCVTPDSGRSSLCLQQWRSGRSCSELVFLYEWLIYGIQYRGRVGR